jgi:hypothetical protein
MPQAALNPKNRRSYTSIAEGNVACITTIPWTARFRLTTHSALSNTRWFPSELMTFMAKLGQVAWYFRRSQILIDDDIHLRVLFFRKLLNYISQKLQCLCNWVYELTIAWSNSSHCHASRVDLCMPRISNDVSVDASLSRFLLVAQELFLRVNLPLTN